MRISHSVSLILVALCAGASVYCAQAAAGSFTMAQALDYPFVSDLTAAERADRIAWVRNLAGARNVWVADGPAFTVRQVTHYGDDDCRPERRAELVDDHPRRRYTDARDRAGAATIAG